MDLSMSIVDIVQSIGVVVTIVISVIGLIQTKKYNEIAKEANKKAGKANKKAGKANKKAEEANKIAEEANKIAGEANKIAGEANKIAGEANKIAERAENTAERALKDSQKDYMPLLTIVDEIKCENKSAEQLCKEITFDLNEVIQCNDDGEMYICNEEDDGTEDDYISICLTIKNIGKGIITKMIIKSLYMCSENKENIKIMSQKDFSAETIFFEGNLECEQKFILCENGKIDINILITKCWYHFLQRKEIIKRITEEEVYMNMEIEMQSTNESFYEQKSLWCNFERGIVKRSSFNEVTPVKLTSMGKENMMKKQHH